MFRAFFVFFVFFYGSLCAEAQNVLVKKIRADNIKTISINGNQIFAISVTTSKSDNIFVKSILDGEYQNEFQIVTMLENDILNLNLEHLSFNTIADDKRNAHKVIAATLLLEIPEDLALNIISDVGSVNLNGNFNSVAIKLLQGYCEVVAQAKTVMINTIDGDIKVVTQNAMINANSNNGTVTLDEFFKGNSTWVLKSINGNITVENQE
jgi:DUF4097 and DUF4098 domain-containing protein YvlB